MLLFWRAKQYCLEFGPSHCQISSAGITNTPVSFTSADSAYRVVTSAWYGLRVRGTHQCLHQTGLMVDSAVALWYVRSRPGYPTRGTYWSESNITQCISNSYANEQEPNVYEHAMLIKNGEK